MLNFGGFVYLHHCQSLIVVAHPFIGVITVITPFRNGRSPHEPTYHSIFNITTLLFQHGCSNILVYLHHSVVVSHLWHIPSTGRGTSQLHRHLRRLFGAVHPLPFAGRFTVTFVPFLGIRIFGQHLGSEVVVFGTGKRYSHLWRHGDITGFFPMFWFTKKTQKKKEHKIYIVKIRSDQQKIWDLYTNLPYQLKISCRVDPNRIDMSRFLYFKILASSEPPEPL